MQGSRCLLEICVNRRESLCSLCQWHEKCVQDNLKFMHIQSQNDGVTWLYLMGYIKWADEILKRRPIREHTHTKCKSSGNLLFTKSLHRLKHRTQHHFPKMNCGRRCQQTQFLSAMEFSNETKLKSRLLPFSLTCIWVSMHVLFSVRSLLPFSKFWYYTLTK